MKAQIIDAMKANGMTASEAEKAFWTTFDAVRSVISVNGKATIPGFGTFHKKQRAERMARNPATGESIKVAAKTVITFKESKIS